MVGSVIIVAVVFFLVRFAANENISTHSRTQMAHIFKLAFVRVELLLKARPRIGSPLQGAHWNHRLLSAKCDERIAEKLALSVGRRAKETPSTLRIVGPPARVRGAAFIVWKVIGDCRSSNSLQHFCNK
jgi:hypothetical protein